MTADCIRTPPFLSSPASREHGTVGATGSAAEVGIFDTFGLANRAFAGGLWRVFAVEIVEPVLLTMLLPPPYSDGPSSTHSTFDPEKGDRLAFFEGGMPPLCVGSFLTAAGLLFLSGGDDFLFFGRLDGSILMFFFGKLALPLLPVGGGICTIFMSFSLCLPVLPPSY